MKLTDLALIFLAITLPIVIIVYVTTSFVVSAQKQEMQYKNLMNAAIDDTVFKMKEVENQDLDIDYGYSGNMDNKISVNAEEAVKAFYNSLYNNFNIAGNKYSELQLKNYIPCLAIIDYDGVYIYSSERAIKNEIQFTLKPKKYFAYTYVFAKENNKIKAIQIDYDEANNYLDHCLDNCIYQVTLTMDDYVILKKITLEGKTTIKDIKTTAFYIDDVNNNDALVDNARLTSNDKSTLKANIINGKKDEVGINGIKTIKQNIISKTVEDEITYAINVHNKYAKQVGITYKFFVPASKSEDKFETINGVGVIAFIQGISLGNRYLNYKAYSLSDLTLSRRYYLSKPLDYKDNDQVRGYDKRKLYHVNPERLVGETDKDYNKRRCPVYMSYLLKSKGSDADKVIPEYVYNRGEAATAGFYPCPVCRP